MCKIEAFPTHSCYSVDTADPPSGPKDHSLLGPVVCHPGVMLPEVKEDTDGIRSDGW